MEFLSDEELARIREALYAPIEKKPIVKVMGGYLFQDLPDVGDIILLEQLLLDGEERTQEGWQQFNHDKEKNPEGYEVPSTLMLYQLFRRLYHLRENSTFFSLAFSCAEGIKVMWEEAKILHTGTTIKYDYDLSAVVEHATPDKISKKTSDKACNNAFDKSTEHELIIPELSTHADTMWTYEILAREKYRSSPPSPPSIGNGEGSPFYLEIVLSTIFGEGHEEAGVVFQFMTPTEYNRLREVRLWVPTAADRANRPAQRCVNLQLTSGDCVNINVNGDIIAPHASLGVMLRR